MKTQILAAALLATISTPAMADPCFERGDASSKTYEAAECTPIEGESLPYECTFADGAKTACFKHDNGCFVCAGMD